MFKQPRIVSLLYSWLFLFWFLCRHSKENAWFWFSRDCSIPLYGQLGSARKAKGNETMVWCFFFYFWKSIHGLLLFPRHIAVKDFPRPSIAFDQCVFVLDCASLRFRLLHTVGVRGLRTFFWSRNVSLSRVFKKEPWCLTVYVWMSV